MVYLRITPLGLAGGSQDTTTLLADEGTALMPPGGPGTEQGEDGVSLEKEGTQPLGKKDMAGRVRLVNLEELLGGGVLELWFRGGRFQVGKLVEEERQSFWACNQVSEIKALGVASISAAWLEPRI